MNAWIYQQTAVTELPTHVVGFVYLITNTLNGRKYIGKKLAKFSKTRYRMVTLKNGTKKRRAIKTKIDSDWLTYHGSSEELQKDVDLHGSQHFIREILHLCDSKAKCTYLEAKEQFLRGVLESNDYYNRQISARVHKRNILDKA